jgi:hypothetical protein
MPGRSRRIFKASHNAAQPAAQASTAGSGQGQAWRRMPGRLLVVGGVAAAGTAGARDREPVEREQLQPVSCLPVDQSPRVTAPQTRFPGDRARAVAWLVQRMASRRSCGGSTFTLLTGTAAFTV